MNLPKKFIKNLNDLSFLVPISEKYQIIGLGEATHGNKEFHIIRANITQFLIENCGYSGVIMEFPYSKSEEINQYILNGVGDLEKIITNLGYWTCATQEIKQFINWLKKFNSDNPQACVQLFGNDVDVNDKIRIKAAKYRDKKIAKTALKIVGKNKYIIWAHNHHISKLKDDNFISMGYFLSQKIKYYNIATLFYKGSFTAMEYNSDISEWGEIKAFELPNADIDSLEAKLISETNKNFFIDILGLPIKIKQQFNSVKVRFLGAGYDPKEKNSMFELMNFSKMFNGFIFFRKVSPSVLVGDN